MKRGKKYQSCGEEYKKGQGKQYDLTYNIEAVGKNIKWLKGVGDFWEDLKNRSGKEYKVTGNFIHPWYLYIMYLVLYLDCVVDSTEESLNK